MRKTLLLSLHCRILITYKKLHPEKIKQDKKEWYYKNIKIFEVGNLPQSSLNSSLFVMRKNDLPCMKFKDVSEKYKNDYNLKKIDDDYCIYASLNDLNDKKLKGNERYYNRKNLSDCVLTYVGINVEIKYNANAKCIQLKEFSQFEDKGSANSINDVLPFDKN